MSVKSEVVSGNSAQSGRRAVAGSKGKQARGKKSPKVSQQSNQVHVISRKGGTALAGAVNSTRSADTPVRKPHRVPAIVVASSIVLVFILLLGSTVSFLWASTLGQIRRENPDLAIHEKLQAKVGGVIEKVPYEKEITNILLLGVDSRDLDSLNERTDSMMILTINLKEKKIKLTSLQRDMLVNIPGREDPDKLTHVNVYGGPKLLMQTIYDNLRIKLDRYVMVNMRKMEELVDILNGIEIDVAPEVLDITNDIIGRANRTFPHTPSSPTLSKAGKQILNGRQAVSYARNRTTGRGDFDRMERQQEVIQAMYNRFRETDPLTVLKLVKEALSNVSTNLSNQEIMGIIQSALPIMGQKIERKTIPTEEFSRPYLGSMWVLLCDFNGMIPDLQKFIYGKTFDVERVAEIPGAPNSSATVPDSQVAGDGSADDADDNSFNYNNDNSTYEQNYSSQDNDVDNSESNTNATVDDSSSDSDTTPIAPTVDNTGDSVDNSGTDTATTNSADDGSTNSADTSSTDD